VTKAKIRDRKGFGAQRMRWIWPICLILVTISRLFASEQSVTDKAWAILQAGLHDKTTDKRVQAVSVLGLLSGDKKAVETVEHALDDPNPDVRRAAITALGDMNSKKSLPKIKALIDHSDAKTVVTIAAVLTKFKDPEGYDIYYQVLTGKRKGGGSIVDGIKDRKAVEKMGVETAIGFAPFGGVATGAYNYFKQNGSSHSNLDVTAVYALADDPDSDAEKALVEACFGGKEAVQIASLHALAKRGDPAVIKEIEPAMYSEKSLISYTAAATILHLSDLRAKQPVGRQRKQRDARSAN
jgi:HEAT repeat protein